MNGAPIERSALLARLHNGQRWDVAVIGGGATGLGVALDAAVRGFSVVLVESHDFAKGTSSRATKLAHGGVRYLAQGDIGLVREALRERGAMLANAPHVAQRLPFVMPGYHWWERGFYGVGLKAYDALAGARGIGTTEWLSSRRVSELLPGVRRSGLWGGVRYWDGQFDDARLAVLLARTAAARGALVVNHCPAVRLLMDGGKVAGVVVQDAESGTEATLQAACVVNAAGVWVDAVRAMDGSSGPGSTALGRVGGADRVRDGVGDGLGGVAGALPAPLPASATGGDARRATGGGETTPAPAAPAMADRAASSGSGARPQADAAVPTNALVAPSQGVHLVVDRVFSPGNHALLVPKTSDGRVLFAVPWLGKTILGTTDTPRGDLAREPQAFREEVDFILRESARVLSRAPQRADVRSVWVGLRPLVRPQAPEPPLAAAGPAGRAPPVAATKAISREHTVLVARSGLVTVTGGKWTTYRAMAEDVLEHAMARGLLPPRPGGVTERLPLLGSAPGRPLSEPPGEHLYGTEAALLKTLPGADRWLWHDAETGRPGLSEAMVRFAVRYEMARDIEDVLARRSRLLFLDAAAAAAVAPAVAQIVADELGRAADVDPFIQLAAQYRRLP